MGGAPETVEVHTCIETLIYALQILVVIMSPGIIGMIKPSWNLLRC